jgi:hypothetical protein
MTDKNLMNHFSIFDKISDKNKIPMNEWVKQIKLSIVSTGIISWSLGFHSVY